MRPILVLFLIIAALAGPLRADEPLGLSQMSQLQRLLRERGFDPGPADGILGAQTRKAIIAFQQAKGLTPTGEPSAELLQRLREQERPPIGDAAAAAALSPKAGGTTTVAPPAAAAAPPSLAIAAARQAQAPDLAGSTWRFEDSTGAIFTLRLMPAGKVQGTTYDRFWSWSQDGRMVLIRYQNTLGYRVLREGAFEDDNTLHGIAESSQGDSWSWVARREPD